MRPAREGRYVDGRRPEIAAAAVALVRPGAALSHECAALAHGLDVLHVPSVATLTTGVRAHAAARSGAVVRCAALEEPDLARWFGVSITTCARTVIDTARRGVRDGIVVADSALRDEVVTHEELRAALTRQHRWGGIATAKRVIALASHLSESPLESLTRLFLTERGIPLPEQQRWIRTYRGWYRVDGLWPELAVILEVDGMVKYQTPSGEDHPLAEEKLRQEALERAGFTVIRVIWSDVSPRPAATDARIRAVLRRAAGNVQPRRTAFSA